MMYSDKVYDYCKRFARANTILEKYEIQSEAFSTLSDKDGDDFFELLGEGYIHPEIVNMGLNTSPGDTEWDSLCHQIKEIVDRDGIAQASWSCTGRTRHAMHATQLKYAMPEYSFYIGDNYQCVIKKIMIEENSDEKN